MSKREINLTTRRIMSYLGKVIWMNEYGFMVAQGDGTDAYFETIEDAMDYIEIKKYSKKLKK